MSSRRAFVLAAVAAVSGGCALASGYDFGKYTETGGAAGAGGRAASATASSGMGAASSTTSSGRPASTSSTSSASASGTGATAGPSTTSSAIATSSSGTGGSTSGTVTVLYDNLLGPENLAIDAENVYFTLNVPGTGKSGAGYVSKEGKVKDLWDSQQDAVPAIWSTGSLVYIATNATGAGHVYSFDVAANQIAGVASEANANMQGLAVWGSTVFFTSLGANTWYVPPAGQPGTLVPNDIAAGPITADATGVYFADANGRIQQTTLNGGIATPLGMALYPVHSMTTDPQYVYWTDTNGGVNQATKGSNVVKVLNAPDSVATWGIAIDDSLTNLYYAHGSNVEAVSFPWGAAKLLVAGLVAPRGVAVDATYVYVADYGTGTAADGRILRITR